MRWGHYTQQSHRRFVPGGERRRHYRISAQILPTSVRPIARAAPRDRSMSRPRVNGPRSLMMTTTVAPVRGLLTLTLVPNGSGLCAAVRPAGRNGSPLAVPAPVLYWVAFIAPPGQVPWADPAKAAPPNQVETSNRRMMMFNFMAIGFQLCQPPLPRRWTAS